MDAKLARIKELLILKESTDAELESLIAGAPLKTSKQRICKDCGQPGHSSKDCSQKPSPISE